MRLLLKFPVSIAFCALLAAAPLHAASFDAASKPPRSLDPATATREPESPLLWYDARSLLLEGKGWQDTPTSFTRLPARAEDLATSPVWWLSKNAAGLCVRFLSDSTTLGAVWTSGEGMNHMARTGSCGLDLYVRLNGKWQFAGVGRPQTTRTLAMLLKGHPAAPLPDKPAAPREYLLYLPLYSAVGELKIGVEPGAWLAPAEPRKDKPVVFYGTSITQGGCASRAGMCHPAILGRWLDKEVVNLGFSGSGKMEPELAALFGELDASLFVLECLPNMTREQVAERVEPFVLQLRKARPKMPILLVENPLYPSRHPLNQTLRKAYENLKKRGVGKLEYLRGEAQLQGPENATVDGVHPTDLGFLRMAQAYYPKFKRILSSD